MADEEGIDLGVEYFYWGVAIDEVSIPLILSPSIIEGTWNARSQGEPVLEVEGSRFLVDSEQDRRTACAIPWTKPVFEVSGPLDFNNSSTREKQRPNFEAKFGGKLRKRGMFSRRR